MKWAIRQSIDMIANGIGVGGFAALLTNEDPEFSDVFRTILVDYREQAVAALASDAPDLDTIIDMVVGSYVAEFARRGTVDPSWGDRIFALLSR